MLTFEKVLEVFANYLHDDTECEVILTKRGYTVLIWDSRAQEWDTCEYCPTPEVLRDRLAEAYANLAELKSTGGKRELTREEQTQIIEERNSLTKDCGK